MAINLQHYYPEDCPEYAHVLEKSETEWLRQADMNEIIRSCPPASTSTKHVTPYQTGLFLYADNDSTDVTSWEAENLMCTVESNPLYYKRYRHTVNNNSRYEKRVYRSYQDFGDVMVVHFRMVELPQVSSGEDTDNSYGCGEGGYGSEYYDSDTGETFLDPGKRLQEVQSLNANGNESKGVDVVRGDWSCLSKEIGDLCLAKILSRGGSSENVVEAIHKELTKIKDEMRNGKVALEKYVINEALTKSPEAYPDSKRQPHVQVALRMRQLGYKEGFNAKDTVPYIICYKQGNTGSTSSAGIAERARHPDELKADDSRWLVDIDYYLAQQIHPVVSRLCADADIQGTSGERLAECLGLDHPSKYRCRSDDATDTDPLLLAARDEEERYKGCEPLALTCPSCSSSFNCPSIISSVCALVSKKTETEESDSHSTFWLDLRCPKCEQGRITGGAMILDEVRMQMDKFEGIFFKATMVCEDCKYTTHIPSYLVVDSRKPATVCPKYPSCNGTLVRKYSEADLCKQISYFCHVLDTQCSALEKVSTYAAVRTQVEEAMEKIKPAVQEAAFIAQRRRDRLIRGDLQWTR